MGIHDDATVEAYKGVNNPILSLNERSLMVLANRHVDDIIIGAPFNVTEDLIATLNIS